RRDPPVQRQETAPGCAGRLADAQASREESQSRRVLGQGMGLKLVEDLEPGLDSPKMKEGVAEKAAERSREVAAMGQPKDGPQRIPLAKPGILPSVEELERLYEELDFPDAADTELDVPALGILAAKRVVDGPLHLTDLVHDTGVEARAEHERPD